MPDLNAHLTDEQLSTFLDDRLDEAERVGAGLHLQSCADCNQSLQGLTYTVRALHALPLPSLPRSFQIVEQPRTTFWDRLFGSGVALKGLAAASAALFLVLFSADMMRLTSPAAIMPIAPAAQPRAVTTSQNLQPTMLPYTAPAESGRAGAAAAPAPATPALVRQADTAAEQRSSQAADGSRLEALTASDASASAAGAVPRLSAATIAAGMITVLLIVGAVVRTIRKV